MAGLLAERTLVVRSLPDDTGSCLDEYAPEAFAACLQCGVCTTSCEVARRGEFPRRQLALFRLGQYQRLVADPTLWSCEACDDCSAKCPSGAEPGRVMAGLRRLAVESFAVPSGFATIATKPASVALLFAAAVALVALTVALGGSFSPGLGAVRTASFLPHPVVVGLFGAALTLSLGATLLGARRAWRAGYAPERAVSLRDAVGAALTALLRRDGTEGCAARRGRRRAHLALAGGVAGLTALAGVAGATVAAGGAYPFALTSPGKLLGNAFALALVAGSVWFLRDHALARRSGRRVPLFESLPTWVLFLLGVSGLSLEFFRVASLPLLAYPTYFAHLVLVLVAFALLPYGKLAHALYRLLVLTTTAAATARPPRGAAAPATLAAARALPVSALLALREGS